MRVNVYSQEITDKFEVVRTTAANTGSSFIGIRFYLESADELKPPLHPDDDSSAVTFWVKSGKGGFKDGDQWQLASLLRSASDELMKLR